MHKVELPTDKALLRTPNPLRGLSAVGLGRWAAAQDFFATDASRYPIMVFIILLRADPEKEHA